MRRTSPKLLVLIAAALSLALFAYVFAGGGSSADRPPRDRLTDQQAGMPSSGPTVQPGDPSTSQPGGEEEVQAAAPSSPPPPEPEVEPGSVPQPSPIVRPAPPAKPTRSATAETRDSGESRAAAKARADALRQAERRQAKERAARTARPPAASPNQSASVPARPRIAAPSPSYNCRYARTRSEIAVCGDAGLARLDRQMAAQSNTAIRQATPAQREVLERSRLRFLYRRDRCQSAGCIAETYRARMSEINDIAARHWQEP